MTSNNINEFATLIKQQVGKQEYILEQAKKTKILLEHALESELLHQSIDFTYNYFWCVSDFAEQAYRLSEQALDQLIQVQQKILLAEE